MSERIDSIQKHLTDQLAVVRHVLQAVTQQADERPIKDSREAAQIVNDIERTMRRQAAALESFVDQYGADTQSRVKKTVTEILGRAAGLYDRVREQTVSRILRDDYTALSLVAMGYTAFHTFALAVKEQDMANTALAHLKEVTPLLVRISKLLPKAVSDEITMEYNFETDPTAGDTAYKNTQAAWSNEIIDTEAQGEPGGITEPGRRFTEGM